MWEEVVHIHQNGVITMYQVLYQPLEIFGGAIGPLNVNVTELTADLTDLEEYVNYTISARAYTSAGEGPYSDSVVVLTDEDCEFHTLTAWDVKVWPPGSWYAHYGVGLLWRKRDLRGRPSNSSLRSQEDIQCTVYIEN